MDHRPVNIAKYLEKRRSLGSRKRPVRPTVERPMTSDPDQHPAVTAAQHTVFNARRDILIAGEEEGDVFEFINLPNGDLELHQIPQPLTETRRKQLIADMERLRPLVGRPAWEESNDMLYEAGI